MAKAKAKTTPKIEAPVEKDETITRAKAKAPSTPKASDVEKTESFTAAFSTDAHAAADYFLKHRTDNSEEISREETDAGDEGRRVTLTYKLGMP